MGVAVAAAPGRGAVPGLQGARLPHALDHRAGHVDPRGAAHRDAREPGAARPARRPRLRLAHRPGVPRRGDRGRRTSARTGSASTRRPTTTRPSRGCTTSPTCIRACTATSRPTCASGSTRCSSARASRSWCASSATTSPSCGAPRTGSASAATIPGMEGLHTSLQAEVPQIDVRVKLDVARRYGVKPGDVRRAAGRSSPARRSATCSSGGVSTNVMVWSTPKTRNSLTAIRNLPIDTPDPRAGPARHARRRRHPPDAERDPARERLAPDRRRSRSAEDPRPRRRDPRHPAAAGPDEAPARLPRGAARRGGRAPERAAPPADLRDRRGAR